MLSGPHQHLWQYLQLALCFSVARVRCIAVSHFYLACPKGTVPQEKFCESSRGIDANSMFVREKSGLTGMGAADRYILYCSDSDLAL